jgi:hypothetical protein
MSNPFELRITLRQHTPIIHFQHHQDGATLRASEVKPKLDRFILNDLNIIRPDLYAKVKSCFIEKDDKIFGDYKLSFINKGDTKRFVVGTSKKDDLKPYQKEALNNKRLEYIGETSYFADMQAITTANFDEVRLGLHCEKVECRFFSLYTDFIENIYEICNYFFAYNSFGTRQNKGFGCFYPIDLSDEKLREILKVNQKNKAIYWKKFEDAPLRVVQSDYQLLKSGRSFGGYRKSLLWAYFIQLTNVRWEKRKFKLEFSDNIWDKLEYNTSKRNRNFIADNNMDDANMNEAYNNGDEDNTEEFAYIRALLGIAEHFEFKTQKNENNRFKDSVKVKVKSIDSEIERYASPILFKVFDNTIYLLATEPSSKILGSKFQFDLVTEFDGVKNENKSFFGELLSVPDTFNISDFLSFCMNTNDNRLKSTNNLQQIIGYKQL